MHTPPAGVRAASARYVPAVSVNDPSHAEIVGLLDEERDALLQLLRDISPAEWDAPTECPAWTVKGIATHLLGDDLSLLSRQRDGAPPAIVPRADGRGFEGLMVEFDAFNEQWVAAASFLGVPLLLELLASVGGRVHEWYASVDPDRLGPEPVHWIGPDPAPYRQLAAREYAERWVHHQQIRRALGRAPLTDPRFSVPAVATVMLGFPMSMSVLPADEGTAVVIALDDVDAAWTLARAADTWHLVAREAPGATTRLALDVPSATAVFSRGLLHQDVGERFTVTGDDELGSLLVAGIAAFFGRPPA
jgi:uncharacterized protein (TIGR03083 family)